MRRVLLMVALIAVLFTFVAGAMAEGVLMTNMEPDSQVVLARKMLMQANKANMGSLMKEIGADDNDCSLANATSIAAIAEVLPPLFKEEYKADYPKDSKVFFKGGDPKAFEMKAADLKMEAMAVHKALAANDKAAAKAAAEKLGAACGACHQEFQAKSM